MLSRRRAWLSITPEPERELPRAIATLKAGDEPSAAAIEREREIATDLVLRGTGRRWQRWLRDSEALARGVDPRCSSDDLVAARDIVLAVIKNHDALTLGLPGGGPIPPRADP